MTTLRVLVEDTFGLALRGVGLDDIPLNDFLLGVTEPTMLNSGVPAGTVMTPYDTDITTPRTIIITTPNTTFVNIDFGNIRVDVRAVGVTFLRCRWIMTVNRTATPMIRMDQNPVGANTQILFCHFENRDQQGYQYNAIQGHNYTVYRSLIIGTVDGIRISPSGGNVFIHGNFVGFLGWFGNDSTHGPALNSGNQTHNDCIQTTYAGGIEIIGNSLWAYPSTVVGTGTPGSGSDTGNTGYWYTQAEAEARRDAAFSANTNSLRSADGLSHESGGILTPLMCNIASGSTALNMVCTDNWFAGGNLHVNYLATNLTAPVGVFKRNRHYDDAFYKVGGRSICYRGLNDYATVSLSGPDMCYFVNDLVPAVKVIG